MTSPQYYCQLGQHQSDQHEATMYCYTDEAHGVAPNTRACWRCYWQHQAEHYPGGPGDRAMLQAYGDEVSAEARAAAERRIPERVGGQARMGI